MDRSTVIASLALAGVFVVFIRQNTVQEELRKGVRSPTGPVISHPLPEAAPIEVAHHMARIQQHAEKLWWSGQAKNLPLAKFYRHEIKEEMEVIADGHVLDDGVPVSDHMKTYGIRAIDALKEQLASDGLKDFEGRYEALIASCNSCHQVTGHPELRMRVPSENRFSGQDFSFQP